MLIPNALPRHTVGRAPIAAALCLLTAVAILSLWAAAPSAATGNEHSITTPDPSVNGIHISLTLDAAGNPVVTYLDAFDRDLKLLHCDDPNCSEINDSIRTPDITSNVGTHSSLILDGAGYPVVSYYAFGESDLRLLHCDDPNCTGFPEPNTSPDTEGDVGSHTSLALDAAGNPLVAYYDATNGNLKLLHCGDPNCSENNNITSPAAMDADAPFTSLTLDGTGHPVIAFRSAASPGDSTPAALSLLHCDDPHCQGDESANIVSFASENGREGSLVLDGDGNPVVAYIDADGRLRLLRCTDPDCANGNESIATVDSASAFQSPSLVLNAAGNPVVAYYDATNGDLMLLHCNDPACLAGTTIVAADTAGDVGLDPSLQLDAAGNPVVAYLDGPQQDLKLLHCRTPDCTQPTGPKPPPSPTATPAATPTPPALAGDADCSAAVDAIDAARILQFTAGLVNSLPCPVGADASGDGFVNSIDSALVLQFVAGLIPVLPP